MTKRKKIEEKTSRVYVFQNVKHNFNLFIDAEHADEAMDKFDLCDFSNRGEWKIFIELSVQPS